MVQNLMHFQSAALRTRGSGEPGSCALLLCAEAFFDNQSLGVGCNEGAGRLSFSLREMPFNVFALKNKLKVLILIKIRRQVQYGQ
jgi:hypothetical protein